MRPHSGKKWRMSYVLWCGVPQESRRRRRHAQCGRRCKRPGCEELVWVDEDGEGRIHDYCRRTCARRHRHEAVRTPSQDSGQVCRLDGCNRPVSVRRNGPLAGRAHDYCTKRCARKYAHRQLGAGVHIAASAMSLQKVEKSEACYRVYAATQPRETHSTRQLQGEGLPPS
eukprot:SAG11_NODE_1368_length_5097_cov_3.426170_7_plen_170_part_00